MQSIAGKGMTLFKQYGVKKAPDSSRAEFSPPPVKAQAAAVAQRQDTFTRSAAPNLQAIRV